MGLIPGQGAKIPHAAQHAKYLRELPRVPLRGEGSCGGGGVRSLRPCSDSSVLQSCLTLCDPIDGSPPGFPVPGILQALDGITDSMDVSLGMSAAGPTLGSRQDLGTTG